MIEIKKARAEDFDSIYPLLKGLNNSTFTKDRWRQLFTRHWDSQRDHFGYMIADNDNVVGFIGTLFSERAINNRPEKLCNLTSWFVKKEYRGESLSLIFTTLDMDCTLTGFTATPMTATTLKSFGYRDASGKRFLIPAIPFGGFFSGEPSAKYDPDAIRETLDAKDLKIFSDHVKFRCCHMIIKAMEGCCYIIFRKKNMRGLPFGQIHYISDREIFLKYITGLSFNIGLHFRIFGLIVESLYLKGRRPRYSLTLRPANPILYRSTSLEGQDIDALYSELFVLDI